eukprot:scaffold34647_cov182-Amphora_coffeaeformis.AAC.4
MTGNQQQGTELEEGEEELTLWQAMFHQKQHQHNNDDVGTYVTTEDAIEKHRKKKEALYENQQKRKEPRQSLDSRGEVPDNDHKKKNGFLARIRHRNSREEPEEVVASATSFEYDTLRKNCSADPWEETTGSVIQPKRDDSAQRTATYRQFGGNSLENIKVEETAQIPVPSTPDHVVVKVSASTVTVHDCLMQRGLDFNLTEPVSLPAVSGRDFVGFVLLCGSKVTNFKPGDRVAGLMRSGGNARYAEIHKNSLVPVPKGLDGAEAACMVSVCVSAYQAINLATKETSVYDLEGKRVLVVGGMDGVGQAIIQMCRKAKATVFATAPDRRHAYVRSILNAIPLPEDAKEWVAIAKGTMDVVFDGVFEGNMEDSFDALNATGKLVCFGHSSLLSEQMGWFGVPFEQRIKRFQIESKPNAQVHDLWDSFKRDPELYKVSV